MWCRGEVQGQKGGEVPAAAVPVESYGVAY